MAAPDVLIIGAGIVGAACAAECAREGLSVTVVEAEVVGGGATAAGMGHLVVMDDSEAQFALTSYSVRLWRELARELSSDAEFANCGTIWVAADEEEMSFLPAKRDYYVSRGVRAEILDARSLGQAEPNLRAGLTGGLLVPDDCVLYPPCAAQFLMEQAQAFGARLEIGKRVAEIESDGVRMENGARVEAGIIVNATGSAAARLTPGAQVRPRKGHLVITDRYKGMVRHQLVELGYLKSAHSVSTDSVAFNVQPRPTGQLLIGSSRQYGNEDRRVDSVLLSRMLNRAEEFMPALGGLSAIRTWTGFRAATPDKLPLIGMWPGHKKLFMAAGHEGLGITTSLATGKLLVDEIVKCDSAIPREPYSPERKFDEPHQH
ncbi:MAG TPA: FAD-dependent oxidoreductase [Candidatus Limnocylindrales bacterium]|nr:FAD-dependent oxidoreductase [Candidatus Limnocylindrales bacterium]